MREKCLFINLGFHEDVALRRIMDSHVLSGDLVVVVTGPPVPASRRAVESLRLQASRMGLEDIVVLSLDPSRPGESLSGLCGFVSGECGGRDIVVELGGGLRTVGSMVLLCLFALRARFSIESIVEGTDITMRVPLGFLEHVLYRLDSRDSQLLKAIGEGFTDYRDIAGRLGVGEKTVANRISVLRKAGLIEKRGRGSPRLTGWGEWAVKIYEAYLSFQD